MIRLIPYVIAPLFLAGMVWVIVAALRQEAANAAHERRVFEAAEQLGWEYFVHLRELDASGHDVAALAHQLTTAPPSTPLRLDAGAARVQPTAVVRR